MAGVSIVNADTMKRLFTEAQAATSGNQSDSIPEGYHSVRKWSAVMGKPMNYTHVILREMFDTGHAIREKLFASDLEGLQARRRFFYKIPEVTDDQKGC